MSTGDRKEAPLLTTLLVRHAESVPASVWGEDEYTRPLSEQGTRDAGALAETLRHRRLDAVYSSPYLRAIQTVAPLAEARGLGLTLVPDFREHLLSPTPIARWREVLEASWLDRESTPGGADSLAITERRGFAALELVRARHAEGTVAIGGHGTIFACLLHLLCPPGRVDCAFHLAMPMPAVYELVHSGARWEVSSGPGLAGER